MSASHKSSPVTNRSQADRFFRFGGQKPEITGLVGQNFVSGHSPDTLMGGESLDLHMWLGSSDARDTIVAYAEVFYILNLWLLSHRNQNL